MNTIVRHLFSTITSADWARSIASARALPNDALRQIRQKLSQSGAVRVCVPLELERTGKCPATAQASSNPASMSLDGILPCESGEDGVKTACTKLELLVENTISRTESPGEVEAGQLPEAQVSGSLLATNYSPMSAKEMAPAQPGIETARMLPIALVVPSPVFEIPDPFFGLGGVHQQ